MEGDMAAVERGQGNISPWLSLACLLSASFSPSRPSVSCLQHDTHAQLGFLLF